MRRDLVKPVMFLIGALFILMGAVSCTKPPEQVTLYVREGAESVGLKQIADHYSKKFNKKVVVNVVGRDGYTASISTKLLSGSPEIDAYMVPSTMIAELASANVLEPLDTYKGSKDDDLLVQNTFKGKTYALPIDLSVLLMLYRSDLIKKFPETWDEYLVTAKQFTKELNSNSSTKYGAAIATKAPEDLSKVFFCMTWSFGGEIEKDGKPLFDSKGSIDAANYYLKFFGSNVTSPEKNSWGVIEIYESLSKGELAMTAPQWNAVYPYLKSSDSKFKDKVEVALVPGIMKDGKVERKSFKHSWTLAINKASKAKKEVYDFINYVVSPEGAKFYALNSIGTPARKSVLTDPEVLKKRPEFKYVYETFQFAKSEPEIVNYDETIKVVNTALTKIFTKEKSPEEALTEATQKAGK
jgi:multiple sugar transport system substrate-binding protein